MSLHPQPGRSIARLMFASAALGFYAALVIVAAVMGDAAFNAAISRPWRMALSIPSLATPLVLLPLGKRGRRV